MNTAPWPPVSTECVKLDRVKNLLGYEGIAELLEVTPATVRSYKRYNRLPQPDILIDGKHPGWEKATIRKWMASRLGPGARTDLITEAGAAPAARGASLRLVGAPATAPPA